MIGSLLGVDDGIWQANYDLADVFFIVAVFLFVIFAVVHYMPKVDGRAHGLLLGLGLACTAFALLVL